MYPDTLNFHNDHIVLIYDGIHYNLLYSQIYLNKYPLLVTYDKVYGNIISEHLNQLGTCVLCGEALEDEKEVSSHSVICKPMHNYCLNERITQETGGKVLYNKSEINNEVMRTCPICKYIFNNEDIKVLFHKEAYEMFKREKKTRKQERNRPISDISRVSRNRVSSFSNIETYPFDNRPIKEQCSLCGKVINNRSEFSSHDCVNEYMHSSYLVKQWNPHNLNNSTIPSLAKNELLPVDLKLPRYNEKMNDRSVRQVIEAEKKYNPQIRNERIPIDSKPKSGHTKNTWNIVERASSVNDPISRKPLVMQANRERIVSDYIKNNNVWKGNARRAFYTPYVEEKRSMQSMLVIGSIIAIIIILLFLKLI